MDIYNRYKMRVTGEGKFQPASIIESIIFGVFNFMESTKALPEGWEQKTEIERNKYMEELGDRANRAIQPFLPYPAPMPKDNSMLYIVGGIMFGIGLIAGALFF
jgi:hypothetical protein